MLNHINALIKSNLFSSNKNYLGGYNSIEWHCLLHTKFTLRADNRISIMFDKTYNEKYSLYLGESKIFVLEWLLTRLKLEFNKNPHSDNELIFHLLHQTV